MSWLIRFLQTDASIKVACVLSCRFLHSVNNNNRYMAHQQLNIAMSNWKALSRQQKSDARRLWRRLRGIEAAGQLTDESVVDAGAEAVATATKSVLPPPPPPPPSQAEPKPMARPPTPPKSRPMVVPPVVSVHGRRPACVLLLLFCVFFVFGFGCWLLSSWCCVLLACVFDTSSSHLGDRSSSVAPTAKSRPRARPKDIARSRSRSRRL